MMRRIRIFNSTEIQPNKETFVVMYEADKLNNNGDHSVEDYVQTCISWGRETLVFRR